MGDATFEARCQLLKEQYEQLDEQKKQIENTMERLQYKISKYENAIKTGELTWGQIGGQNIICILRKLTDQKM